MNRREVLLALGATSLLTRHARAAPRIRPPGALAPGSFEHACIGCSRCAEVCPSRAIRFERGLPVLELRDSSCVLCMKCPGVCPTGALVPLPAEQVRMGTPVLERSRCLPWSGAGTCRICYYVCPYPDRAVELVGEQAGPLFHPEACTGCGQCEEACPDLAHAIRIRPAGEPK